MESKLNLYDFVGYFIPGAIVFGMIYWALIEIFKITLAFDALGTIGGPIVFLIICYLCGHILSSLAINIKVDIKENKKKENEAEGKAIKAIRVILKFIMLGLTIKEYYFSKEFLKDKDEHYNGDFKKKLRSALKETWEIETNDGITDSGKNNQTLFYLCNKLCIQENLNPQIEIFNSFYGFYRNLLMAFGLSILICYIIIIKNIIILCSLFCDYICCCSKYFFPRSSLTGLWLPLLLIIIILVTRKPLEKRQETYGKSYVSSVYESFYAWYRKKQTPKEGNTQNEINTD